MTSIPSALYAEILRCLPIACVDLLVLDPAGRALLLRRANAPAKGEWWFPGGRVLHGETREAAARRKLAEECGLAARRVDELRTADLIFTDADGDVASHGVTTLFRALVDVTDVRLDAQSAAHAWRAPREWLREPLHPFVRGALEAAA
jgi:colanic acid biosynthesis protein WcaH